MNRIRDYLNKLSPSIRRVLNVVIVIVVSITTAILLLNFLLPYLVTNSNLVTNSVPEAIASVGIIVTITITAINLVSASMNKRYSSKKQLSLAVSVSKGKVIITSTIENTGTGRITPKSFYLFINSGIKKQGIDGSIHYDFPNILKHECNEFDCSLAKKCKASRIEKIPDELMGKEYENTVSICKLLNHIAADSVNFIDPGEIFSEDTLFELNPGVYRVILLGVSVEADCMCAHKIFVVEEEKNEDIGGSR